jgi:hypothetical protein
MVPRVMPRIALELGPESSLALPVPVGRAGTDKSDIPGAAVPVAVPVNEPVNEPVVEGESVVAVEVECVVDVFVDVCRALEVVLVFDAGAVDDEEIS